MIWPTYIKTAISFVVWLIQYWFFIGGAISVLKILRVLRVLRPLRAINRAPGNNVSITYSLNLLISGTNWMLTAIFFLDCRFKIGHSSSDCVSVYYSKYRYGHPFAYIHVRCDRCSTIQRKILFLYRFFKGIWKILLGFFQTKQKWNECIQHILLNKFGFSHFR